MQNKKIKVFKKVIIIKNMVINESKKKFISFNLLVKIITEIKKNNIKGMGFFIIKATGKYLIQPFVEYSPIR